MLRFQSINKMPHEIISIEIGGCGVIQHHQVVFTIAVNAVLVGVIVNVPEPLVQFPWRCFIDPQAVKISCFGGTEHITVHPVGAEHNVIAQPRRAELPDIVV